jgi:hypothetical protein
MHWQNIRLETAKGNKLDINDILTRAANGDTGTSVAVPLKGRDPVSARLVVRPLPLDRAEEARAQKRRTASKKGRNPSPLGLKLAGVLSLLTTIPNEFASDEAIMEFYRVRWQVELFFKRCKSLLNLDSLRATDPRLVRTYCVAKLIHIALVELLASEGEAFSPWGFPARRLRSHQPLETGPYASG